ncbi:amino acid adenylation domain-containing protein [Pleurocapsa sp. FMAR1]|uniref:amino acid adenylation domain-containing protein n=1 Tax=Pleurocapsa sp. FMAR1 TaxID=3040204 RepID=UPI0029C7B84F|nr:amino acid adenylation domain-containing protein [Pleurocapsa sp. FMAR1]
MDTSQSKNNQEVLPKNYSFDCYLIGEGSLLIKCAELLLQQKYRIKGIVSPDLIVKRWADTNKIINLKDQQQLLKLLKADQCDYLFSIVNHAILLPETIAQVSQAINYHDALLPSYAGVNATAWAIINGEVRHGITWHEITAEIDTGNILKQVKIDLEASETTLTLNTKCYQAAIAAFSELIKELASDRVNSTFQDLQQRSYYPRHQKPQALGIIDFNQPAAVIDNLVRGLSFGNYTNSLTTAKLILNSSDNLDYVIINRVAKLTAKSQYTPGTIVRIESDRLIVTTASQDIALQDVTTKQGKASSIEKLVTDYQLEYKQQLPQIDSELSSKITTLATKLSPAEGYWRKQLIKWEPLTLPRIKKLATFVAANSYRRVKLPLSNIVIDFIQQTYGMTNASDVVMAIFAIYIARLSVNQQITLGFEGFTENGAIAPWFATCVPANLRISSEDNLATAIATVTKRRKLNQKYQSYATDLIARSPQLANKLDDFTVSVGQNVEHPSGHLTLSIESAEYYWLYNVNVFSEELIATMLEQWQTLTAGIVSQNPNYPIAHLPLISDSEKKRLLAWNQTTTNYRADLCLHQLFEARVIEDSEAIAVVYQGQSLTRGELNRQANKLANHLQQLGVQPESLVGICLERSLEMAIALFAILKAGGAYLPIDPNYPPARLSYILEDASLNILLTQTKQLERLPKTATQIICLDRDGELPNLQNTNPLSQVNSHNLAYVIYTSGSTGNPKGVAIEHHSAVNTLWDIEQRFAVQPQDRVLAVSSLSFDLSVYDIFGSLGSGGTAILPPSTTRPNPEQWLELIAQEQVTIWNSAPALLELLVNYIVGFERQLPSSLRLVMLSGDRLNPNLVIQLQNLNPQLQIVSLGGATEASIWSICYPIASKWTADKAIPYGRPLHNQSFYILDSQQQLAPIGVTGELYIGGVGVARGYLHRPELTTARFIVDPFSSDPTARLYKTGDLGRYLEDGNIEFLGRIDNQVKIRGIRIELGEIETALLQCPEIQETLVSVNDPNAEQKSLVAYSILKPNSALTSQQLRSFLATQLPEYAIPADFIFTDAFPLTPNGKVDLKALLTTPTKRASIMSKSLPLQSPLEFKLSQIWSEVLNVQPIARDDDFFSLGGNSLLALRLFERIHKSFGANLPLATLFEAPTISQLASIILDRGWSASRRSSLVNIQPHGTKPPLFCIHPVGGNVLTYYSLAKALGNEQPFYGLQSRGWDGREPLLICLEEMAADYLQEIRLVQPQGPYYLGGHSFGGFVAYEIACQLEQQGESIALLALFDCLGPKITDKNALQKTYIHFSNFTQLSTFQALDYVKSKIKYRLKAKVLRSTQQRYFKFVELFLSPQQKLAFKINNLNYQILRKYTPQTYGGKLTLFRAKIRDAKAYFDADGGWKGMALGGVDTYEIPGDHASILSQADLAQIIAERIDNIISTARKTRVEN